MTVIGKKDGKLEVYDLGCESLNEFLAHYFDECFEVDSLIATIIVVLNSKGYLTEMSCDEHFHDSIEFDIFPDSDVPADVIVENKTDCGVECHYINKSNIQKSFIRFKSNYDFSCLPKKWEIEDGVYLFHKYDPSLSEYDFYIEQAKAMKELFDWANSLPEIY